MKCIFERTIFGASDLGIPLLTVFSPQILINPTFCERKDFLSSIIKSILSNLGLNIESKTDGQNYVSQQKFMKCWSIFPWQVLGARIGTGAEIPGLEIKIFILNINT